MNFLKDSRNKWILRVRLTRSRQMLTKGESLISFPALIVSKNTKHITEV